MGPPATFLALPALPGIIIASALAGGLGFIALAAAQVVGWVAWAFLSYLLVIVNAFAAMPLHHIEVASFHPGLVWAYYAGLGTGLWLYHHRQQRNIFAGKSLPYLPSGTGGSPEASSRLSRKWLVTPLLVAAIVVTLLAVTMPDNRLHVSFLNVGQGDAILIQQGSQQVLVDGGPGPQAIGLELGRKMPFWDRAIELVILTHPSADHVSGLVEVLKRYEVKRVFYPDLDFHSGVYHEWLRLLGEKAIKSDFARAGQEIDLGRGTVIEVLNPQNPPLTGTDSDLDNNAIILRLNKREVSFLLTADLMREGEHGLIYQRANLGSTVFKVAHHGSATSTTPELLSVADPALAVISVGAANTYGHPTDEVMTRLTTQLGSENIYRTDEDGTIEFITDGEGLWVQVGK